MIDRRAAITTRSSAASIELGPRHFEQKVNTYYGTATLDGSIGRRVVLGRQRHLRPRTRPSRRCSATSTPEAWSRRWARSPVAPAPCVPLDMFGTPGSITRPCSTSSASTSMISSKQTIWGARANISGKLVRRRRRSARRRGGRRISQAEGPLRPRSSRCRRAQQLGHSGAAVAAAATTSARPMPSSTRPSSRTGRSLELLELERLGALLPL